MKAMMLCLLTKFNQNNVQFRDLKRIQSGRPGPARPAIFGPARTGQNRPEIPGRPANFRADPNGPARSGPDKRAILIQVPNLNSCYQINVL